jgi:hypothetical protein
MARMRSIEYQRETLPLDVGGEYRLTRLSDGEFLDLKMSSIAIDEVSPLLEMGLRRALDMSLGEFYSSMKALFGERGRMFDDWKGAFSFPLAIEVPGAARRPAYVLNVIDFRGGVDHRFRKVVAGGDPRLKTHYYYPPDADEFSMDEMERFLSYFVAYQKGYYETASRHSQEPFLLCVESNFILYGFDGQEFFDEQFDSKESFTKRRAELEDRLPVPGFYVGQRSSSSSVPVARSS